MAVLNITELELLELIGQVENDEIEIAEAWNYLGGKGDGYAFLAGAIVSDDTENMDVIARAFYEMVRSLWGNTGAGEELGVWGGEVFFGVGKEHLMNYLEFLREHDEENGYLLPTTKDIEASYKAALAEYGLLPDTAIDAHFSVIDYFLGDGNGEPPNDISWATFLDQASTAMGGPAFGEDRIVYNSDVFINDIDPIDAVLTLGRTVMDAYGFTALMEAPDLARFFWTVLAVDETLDFTMIELAKQNAAHVLCKRIDGGITTGQAALLLETVANDNQAAPGELVTRIGRVFDQALVDSNDTPAQIFENVKSISDLYEAGGWSLSIERLGADLAALALGDGPEALAYRYALVNMNPFVITGDTSIYNKFNQSGELDIFDPANNTGSLTKEYIVARAAPC